jgi:nucleotide-binding universal stress UspA family protein
VALAKKFGTELVIMHVIMTPRDTFAKFSAPAASLAEYHSLALLEGRRILDQIVTLAEGSGVKPISHLTENSYSVVQIIVEEAEKEKVDLIVIGSRGLGRFKRLLLGSVSTGVANHANCAVLVVR